MKAYLALLLLAPALAHAQEPEPASEQLTLPKRGLVINAFLEINLSKDAAGKPISLTPDIWYGVTDELTLGLVHSSVGATGVLGGVGDAICLSGTDNGCRDVYPGLGLDARYRLKGPFAVDGGLYIRDFDPFELAIKVGISARWRFGKLALEVQPNLFFGLSNRDSGNKELLSIPVTAAFALAAKWEIAAQLGLVTPFENAGDTFRIPLSLGVRFQATAHLGLGLLFSLPALGGGSAIQNGFDARTLTLGGSYAL